jgi:hypothetical protein
VILASRWGAVGERRPHVRWGGPRPAREPAGAAVMGAAPGVTPCRGHIRQMVPGSTVRDLVREPVTRPGPDGSASRGTGGDVGAADKVAVPGKPAMRAAEHAPGGLRDALAAVRAGGRGAALDQHGHDPGLLSLIGQAADQVTDPPVPHPLVMPPPSTQRQHPPRVTDLQRPHPVRKAPVHNLDRGFVLGLADPPPVRGFPVTLAGERLVPPPRPPHPARCG